jgi:plastocyanin
MKRSTLGAVVASIALLAACGSDDPADDAGEAASSAVDDAGDAATEDESANDDGAGSDSTVLLASVGTADDPEAFEIALTTEDGEPVETLPAGDYTIEVDDPATTHNFHLTGGSVDETTSVPETEQTTFEVTLEPGEYTYKCDPHPPMTGTFTVT